MDPYTCDKCIKRIDQCVCHYKPTFQSTKTIRPTALEVMQWRIDEQRRRNDAEVIDGVTLDPGTCGIVVLPNGRFPKRGETVHDAFMYDNNVGTGTARCSIRVLLDVALLCPDAPMAARARKTFSKMADTRLHSSNDSWPGKGCFVYDWPVAIAANKTWTAS